MVVSIAGDGKLQGTPRKEIVAAHAVGCGSEVVVGEKFLVQSCLDTNVIPARRARKVRQSREFLVTK